jgi:hypothetical protein
MALSSPGILSISYLVHPEIHRRTLPPGCAPGEKPRVLVVVLQVAQSDVSTLPFNELWLFSQCVVEGQPAWYALANIVGSGGDVVFGRDVFGYPSKQGTIDIDVTKDEFSVTGTRLGRQFFGASTRTSGKPIPPGAGQMRVVGLKACPSMGSHRSGGKLTIQPWTVQCFDAFALSPDSIAIEMPDTSSPGMIGKRDPWFELKPLRIESVSLARGVVKRMPARYMDKVPTWEPYFLERCDGCLNPDEALRGGGNDTFLV